MKVRITESQKNWIKGLDESSTDYLNRLISNHKYIFPREGVSVWFSATHNNSTDPLFFKLTPENHERLTMASTAEGATVDSVIRALISEDMRACGKSKEQELITYPEMITNLYKKEIDIEKVNKNSTIQYRVAQSFTEFRKIVNQLLEDFRFSYVISSTKVIKERTPYWTILNVSKIICPYYFVPTPKIAYFTPTSSFENFIKTAFRLKADFYSDPTLNNLTNGAHISVHTGYLDHIFQETVNGHDTILSQPIALSFAHPIGEGVLLKYPDKIIKNEQNIHSLTGPAVHWGNEKHWAIENISVPRKFVESPQEITKNEFQRLTNVELRRIATQQMGADRVARLLDLELIDTGKRGELYGTRKMEETLYTKLFFVKVKCPSTDRKYFIPINPDELKTLSADCAVAWTFGKNEEDYNPRVET